MQNHTLKHLQPVSYMNVTISGDFWRERQAVNRLETIPAVHQLCESTGRIDAFKLDWEPGKPNMPHHFWDSDVAKWIEAAAYSLATAPDPQLEATTDGVIDLIADAQQEDGYLNSYYTVVEPENRWSNLRDMHELYCAGHLIEAAVAYYEATGKRKLLDVMCRFADYIGTVFGSAPGQKRGYPGHEEIELALVKLYRVTGEQRYLDLSAYFVDERGRQPYYFDIEARERGEDPQDSRYGGNYDISQSHVPVGEQTTAEGHSVRAMYLYAAMADLAAETGDADMLAACEKLWQNVTERRMYVSGGIGSSWRGERFTTDYDLPNDTGYAETCAAIGLVLWAHRMLQFDGDGRYADILERALYNGVISGVSLDGKGFFYANPLDVIPSRYESHPELFRIPVMWPRRQEWFACSCCPTNIARTLASLGQYVASIAGDTAYLHMYVGGDVSLEIAGAQVKLTQQTEYPWEGSVRVEVQLDHPAEFALALRIPGWCSTAEIVVNGQALHLEPLVHKRYASIRRVWSSGDVVEFSLAMPVLRLEAHPEVSSNCGKVALQRGPLVYCLEEVDNGPNLRDISLSGDAELTVRFVEDLLGGIVVIEGESVRRSSMPWDGQLYSSAQSPVEVVPFRAIPYCYWANRDPGEMLVWINRA